MYQQLFQEKLLPDTLQYASSAIPYYQKLSNAAGGLDFQNLPILRAADLSGRETDFSNLQRFPDGVLLTGGTTSSPGLIFRTVEEEQVAIFHRTGLRPGDMLPTSKKGFGIQVVGAQHGFGPIIPYNQPMIRLPVNDIRHVQTIARFMREGLNIANETLRPNILVGNLTRIKVLSSALSAINYTPEAADTAIEVIASSSFLTPYWRRKLKQFWYANVHSAYGLTELGPTASVECGACNGFHLSDMIFWEILHPVTLQPITKGCGLLVATTLFPFFSSMLRLRYSTGDYVRLIGGCPYSTGPVIQLIGREFNSPLFENDTTLDSVVSMRDVLDVLEEIPWVEVENPLDALFKRSLEMPKNVQKRCGHVRVALHSHPTCVNPNLVVVEIERHGTPEKHAQSLAQKEARQALLDIPSLSQWLQSESHSLEIVIHDSGGLRARGRNPSLA